MSDTVFLTGGTGFLGTELAARLPELPIDMVYVLVRAADEEDAIHRLRGCWQHEKGLCAEIGRKVRPVPGDFTRPDLGLSEADAQLLREQVTLVLHTGAEVGFRSSRQELFETNVTGTEHVLAFAGGMRHLRRFVHLSTAYVAGQKSGVVMEEEPAGTSFSTYYEESKTLAEARVRASGLPFSICRPGMIVGDSRTGWIRSFNTVYYLLKRMLLGQVRVLPIRHDTAVNIVPADYVADAVLQIAFDGEAAGRTFHLTCPASQAPSAGELADYVRAWARENLSVSLPKPVFAPVPALKQAGLRHNRREAAGKKDTLSTLLTLLPYFYGGQIFDRTNTDRIAGPFRPDWRAYMDRLLAFACRKNFMRQTGETVFAQACARRESTRYPITYYDITETGIRRMTGPEVNRRIEKIASAMWARGIRKGDRIAISGVNSASYLAIEQAIGLLGAVSVPIYYTTPAEEAVLLLQKSGARWFFIGDVRMMRQAEQLGSAGAALVSFSAGQEIRCPSVMRFGQFLASAGEPAPSIRPDPDDLATIRYTSGTTGEPKGVMFSFGQLAWMGEVLTNLLPWTDRNRSMRYLSFLPLSHVVEGILALYAPYYVLAKVDYYFLQDFSALTDALPKVRPNVFFSVPRFYEKVWDQVQANRIGKLWLSEEDGPARRALTPILRQAVLRKAGIDRCRQLIVGSAPVSETLLLGFRELGIEIHNAYGQTEAPLITINRLGDNVIPTIGTPLPDTTVRTEPDGELIVEGPQVALGYYGLQTDSIRDGVLRTGDLGAVHENGHITLFGRKKEMIVTAYGKNISIPKLEEKLKDIPGVSEAVLIGDRRPYCTALLWTEEEHADLDEAIRRMNEGLSHPEQIRRYRVISRPLGIREGELTPNLKVKRGQVELHFADEIEEMYR